MDKAEAASISLNVVAVDVVAEPSVSPGVAEGADVMDVDRCANDNGAEVCSCWVGALAVVVVIVAGGLVVFSVVATTESVATAVLASSTISTSVVVWITSGVLQRSSLQQRAMQPSIMISNSGGKNCAALSQLRVAQTLSGRHSPADAVPIKIINISIGLEYYCHPKSGILNRG